MVMLDPSYVGPVFDEQTITGLLFFLVPLIIIIVVAFYGERKPMSKKQLEKPILDYKKLSPNDIGAIEGIERKASQLVNKFFADWSNLNLDSIRGYTTDEVYNLLSIMSKSFMATGLSYPVRFLDIQSCKVFSIERDAYGQIRQATIRLVYDLNSKKIDGSDYDPLKDNMEALRQSSDQPMRNADFFKGREQVWSFSVDVGSVILDGFFTGQPDSTLGQIAKDGGFEYFSAPPSFLAVTSVMNISKMFEPRQLFEQNFKLKDLMYRKISEDQYVFLYIVYYSSAEGFSITAAVGQLANLDSTPNIEYPADSSEFKLIHSDKSVFMVLDESSYMPSAHNSASVVAKKMVDILNRLA